MKKRWLSVFVENEVGVLARIAGIFSAKSYNLQSLTVGETGDNSVSRMTIGVLSDDETLEKIKKQLNGSVEVIKIMDLTDEKMHIHELMFASVHCSSEDGSRGNVLKLAEKFGMKVLTEGNGCIVLESVARESTNNEIIAELKREFSLEWEIVRGGSVAIEAAC